MVEAQCCSSALMKRGPGPMTKSRPSGVTVVGHSGHISLTKLSQFRGIRRICEVGCGRQFPTGVSVRSRRTAAHDLGCGAVTTVRQPIVEIQGRRRAGQISGRLQIRRSTFVVISS